MTKNKDNMTQKEIDGMCRKITNWLSQEGMYKDKVPDDKSHFHLIGELPNNPGMLFQIVQPKNRDDLIAIVKGLIISPEHLTKLNDMEAKEKADFLWDIKYGLLFRESSFNMLPDGINPDKIQFVREIRYDGLTKNELMESISENHKCALFVIWKLMERFGQVVSGSQSNPMFG